MNILYYMEPYPVRNMFINFTGTLAKLNSLIKASNEKDKIYIYSNKAAISFTATKYHDFADNLIYPNEGEEAFFQSSMKNWETEGISEWISLMRTPDRRYIDIIKRICKQYDIELIIHWASNASVKVAAKEINIGYVDMELGCSRIPYMATLAADPWGVNGSSVLSSAKIKDLNIVKDIQCAEYDLQYSAENERAILCGYNYITNNTLLSVVDNSKKIAFIPLQLFDDANLLIYSPYKSPKEALQDVLPVLEQNGYFCIIKEHPLSQRRGGLSLKANKEAKSYAALFKNILWIDNQFNNINNAVYYKMADLVITVNSSAGFEALFYDKPCVVLGDAVYKIGGVFPSLHDFFSRRFSFKEYQYHAAQIRAFFLRYYLLNEKLLTPEYFLKKIKFIGNLSRQNLTVKQIVDAYYHYGKEVKNV